jgi:GT2 family glycosyltransferase
MAQHILPNLTVAIISFNTSSMLRKCLTALFEACDTVPIEVIVVDNASADGSVEMVRASFPQVQLIANHENVGFGAANNQAISVAQGQYVLLLNSDTIVWPGAIEQLLRQFEGEPTLAAVGPRLMGRDGKWQRSAFRFPSPLVLLLEQLNLARFTSRERSSSSKPSSDDVLSVDWLIGACLLVRHAALDSLGSFDTRFFMYGEDIDLCYRLRGAGWDIRLVPGAAITHLGGMSTRRHRLHMAIQATASMYQFYDKHYSKRDLQLAAMIFRGTALIRSLRDLGHWFWLTLQDRNPEGRATLLDDLSIWFGIIALQPPVRESMPRQAPDSVIQSTSTIAGAWGEEISDLHLRGTQAVPNEVSPQ